jgi:hypothetical protein
MILVDFDFKMLRCSPNHRQRLAKIYKDVQSPETKGAAERRLHLLDLLTACSFDPTRGVYVPFSETVFLPGKLQKPPVKIESLTAPINQHFPYTYFTNPLVLPLGYDAPDFEVEDAPAPKDRLTNAGFIVITSELDCERIEEFEQNLDWFAGKDGDFASAPFAALDRELRRHHDYRGYCAVYSGRRSIHMHFVYDTKHLMNAPWEADWQSRLDSRAQTAAVMQKAHGMAWDHVHQGMARILAPLGKPDQKLRTPTQWRRTPFGINRLEKNCDFLGLSRGQRIPQIVIYENVRERKPKGSREWLIDPHLSATITSRSRSKGGVEDRVAAYAASSRALQIIREACEAEWDAPFPRAEKAGIEGGEVIIRFANHAGDKNPSTFVKGKFRRLEVCGNNDFDRDFYLPGDLTASEFVSWAAESADAEESRPDEDSDLTPEQRAEIIERERKTIGRTTELYLTPEGRDRLITAIEGAGKTQGLLDSMSSEMLDRAMDAPDDAPQHFMCYAARSKQQAMEKRREYDKRRSPFDCKTVVLESFWTVYAEKCAEAATEPLEQYDFESRTANEVMRTIKVQQPEVYRLLEEHRRNFWNDAPFDCSATMIFTTKATIRTWYIRAVSPERYSIPTSSLALPTRKRVGSPMISVSESWLLMSLNSTNSCMSGPSPTTNSSRARRRSTRTGPALLSAKGLASREYPLRPLISASELRGVRRRYARAVTLPRKSPRKFRRHSVWRRQER